MNDFDRIKMYYDKKWATLAQVRQYVVYGKITSDQFTEITGETY